MKQLFIVLLMGISFSAFSQTSKKGFTTTDSILLVKKMNELVTLFQQRDSLTQLVDSIGYVVKKELPVLEVIVKRLENMQTRLTSADSSRILDSLELYFPYYEKILSMVLNAKKVLEKLQKEDLILEKRMGVLRQEIEELLKKKNQKPIRVNYSAPHTIAILHRGSLFIFILLHYFFQSTHCPIKIFFSCHSPK